MNNAYNNLIEKLEGWGESIILMLPNFALAIIVVVVFIFLARGLRKLFLKIIARFSDNKAVNKLIASLITVTVILTGLFIALGVMELDKAVTSLLAGAGVVGLAVGLAFQDPLLNILSGIIMSFRKPFGIGDMVETNDYAGEIISISLRSINLKTFTGENVIIPNKLVLQNPLKNYTLTKYRRVDVDCGVSYNDDLEKVKSVAIESIENNIEHDKSKPVEFIYNEFGDSSINFTLRFWLEMAGQKSYLVAKSDAIIAIKNAFDENNIDIPFPIRTLMVGNPKVLDKISQSMDTPN